MPIVLTEAFVYTQYDPTYQNPIQETCIPMIQQFHEAIIVPLLIKFGTLIPTSGNRSVKNNTAAHGQPNSEHLYTPTHCALDFYSPNIPMRSIFDWMRLDPSLPFHQLILEHGANGSSVIHVSMNTAMPGIRSVLEGATHNSEEYAKIDHVDFIPPINNHDAIQDATAG